MDPQQAQIHQEPPRGSDNKQKNYSQLIVIVLFFVLSLCSTFIGGYFLRGMLNQTQVETPVATSKPSPSPQNVEENPTEGSEVLEGRQYYEDTYIAYSNNPKIVLLASVSRKETESGTLQSTRVSYFDGNDWTRKTTTKIYPDTSIYTNEIVKQWKIVFDPSRVLQQSVLGQISISDKNIIFNTNILTNNISVRSLPGYTKFISNADADLIVNTDTIPVKILYTRIYSNNTNELQFYDSPLGLHTYWLAFWDTQGNFYHIDSTQVDNPTPVYKTHQFAALVDSSERVSKSFDVQSYADSDTQPSNVQFIVGKSINKTINFIIGQKLNKAPNNSYTWFVSEGEGTVNGVPGFGILEFIRS